MLHKLVFDTTDANTIADSHHVGSHVLSGTGTLIGSQTVAGTNDWLQVISALTDGTGNVLTSTAGALDVNLKTPIVVETDMNGIYNVGTNSIPANSGLISFTRGATPGLTSQVETPTSATAASDAVVAANVHGLDVNGFNMGYNGTTWDRIHSTSGSMNVNITNSLTVSDAALANTALAAGTTTLTVASTAVDAVAAPQANRKYLWIYNNDNRTMYIGGTGVTAAGMPIPPGSMMEMRAGPAVAIQLFSAKALHDSRHMELS